MPAPSPEDAPTPGIRVRENRPQPDRLPIDPGLVDIDIPSHELPELPFEAIDFIEEIDSNPPAPPRAAPPPAPAPPAVLLDTAPLAVQAPPARAPLFAPMAATFAGSLCATLAIVLIPWFAFVSPSIEASRQARRAEVSERVATRVVEVPVPVAAPAPPAAEPETTEPEAVEPEAPEPEVEVPAIEVAAPEVPAPVTSPIARPTPKSVPTARTAPRAKPSPRPAPVARTAPAPAEPEPVVAATPEPAPAPVAPPPKPAGPEAPAAAVALNGRMSGNAGGTPVILDVKFEAKNRLTAMVQRGSAEPVRAVGRYNLNGDSATFNLTEAGGTASYAGTLDRKGISGQLLFPSGKRYRLKARR